MEGEDVNTIVVFFDEGFKGEVLGWCNHILK